MGEAEEGRGRLPRRDLRRRPGPHPAVLQRRALRPGPRLVDAHTAVAQFRMEAGCRCLRHQPLHLLFTADGRLFAFEVLDPGVIKNQHRNDLYVRWATPTPNDERARARGAEDYLKNYTAAARLQTCGRPGRKNPRAAARVRLPPLRERRRARCRPRPQGRRPDAPRPPADLQPGRTREPPPARPTEAPRQRLPPPPPPGQARAATTTRASRPTTTTTARPTATRGRARTATTTTAPRRATATTSATPTTTAAAGRRRRRRPRTRPTRHRRRPTATSPCRPSPRGLPRRLPPPGRGAAEPAVALPTTHRGFVVSDGYRGEAQAARATPSPPLLGDAPAGLTLGSFEATITAAPLPGRGDLSGFCLTADLPRAVRGGDVRPPRPPHRPEPEDGRPALDALAREVVERRTGTGLPPDGRTVALQVRSCPGKKPTAVAEWAPPDAGRRSTRRRWPRPS